MSVLIDLIYGGSTAVVGLAEAALREAVEKYGPEKEVAFPSTACGFPLIYALTGTAVQNLGDLAACIAGMKARITNEEDLEQALNAGLTALMGAEITEGIKYLENPNPSAGECASGFLPDSEAAALAQTVLNGTSPGMALIMGRALNAEKLVSVVREYQSRNILTFLVGDVIEQCIQGGVTMEGASKVIPLGHDAAALIYAITVPVRAALLLGGCKPGNSAELREYVKTRIPTFVNTFGDINAMDISAAAGAMAFGSPVVVDIDLGACQLPGVLESVCNHSQTVERSLVLAKLQEPEVPEQEGDADPE